MHSKVRLFSEIALWLALLVSFSTCKPTLSFTFLTGRPSMVSVVMSATTADSFGDTLIDRRSWLAVPLVTLPTFMLGFPSSVQASSQAVDKLSTFNDPTHGFSIQVPADWKSSVQTLRDRRQLRIWLDPSDASGKTGLFIAYTPIRDDFTSLGSFGSVDQVAAQTILPKGEIAGQEGVNAKMLSAKSEKQAYFFDYIQNIAAVQSDFTHFRTIFALAQGATGGAGAVLVTITAQTPEDRYSHELQPLFDKMIASYGKALASDV